MRQIVIGRRNFCQVVGLLLLAPSALRAATSSTTAIRASELDALLSDERTAESALATYFQLVDATPFRPAYELRPEVELIAEGEDFAVTGAVMRSANSFKRRRRQKEYLRILAEDPTRLRLVAEGDSWFLHPGLGYVDIIDNLINHFAIYSLAAAGDELDSMFRANEYEPALREQQAKVLLLSGGGNDLLGKHFDQYVNDYSSGKEPHRFVKEEALAKIKDLGQVYAGISDTIASRLPHVTVVTHGYDYVVPRIGSKGKWLGKVLRSKGISKPEDQRGVVRVIIDEFNSHMRSIAQEHSNLAFVDLRGTVRETQWQDEIHPDRYGSQQLALKLLAEITKRQRR